MTEVPPTAARPAPMSWLESNRAILDLGLELIRLRLARRIRWLRPQWRQDPLQAFQGLVVTDGQADRMTGGDEVTAEARCYTTDPDAVACTEALRRGAAEQSARRAALAEAGRPSALDKLGRLFELTGFEQEVLMLCLAPNLDATFRRLYAYVQDDPSRQYPTPDLCLRLLRVTAGGEPAVGGSVEAFLPDGALRQYGLLDLGGADRPGALSTAPLVLDERITAYLLGRNALDERARTWLRAVPEAPLAPVHQALVSHLADGLGAETARGVWPVINLLGPAGVGQGAVGRTLCERAGLRLFRLDLGRLPLAGADLRATTRLLSREAVLLQLAYYLEATAIEPGDREPAQAVDEVLGHLPGPLLLASRERWPTSRDALVHRMPALDAATQVSLWQGALDRVPHALNGHVHALAQQFQFGPETVATTVQLARRRALLRQADPSHPLEADDLWAACRESSGRQLDTLCQVLTGSSGWDDIVLPEDVGAALREVAGQVAHRGLVYETWGFGARLDRGRGISALFSGPSGTGKTMAAEIVARHLHLDLYRIDLASMVSKYIGETEKNLKRVFDAAEQSGAILFFDEADALFGKRTEVKDSHDRYANIEVDYLLQRMEAYRGLAILATNRKTDLDRAFLRRIRFVINFPFPDARSREAIWRRAFPATAPQEGLNYEFLARLEITGGTIRNAALNAAFMAAARGEPIRMDHVLHTLRREYDKIEKLITRAEFGEHYHRVAP